MFQNLLHWRWFKGVTFVVLAAFIAMIPAESGYAQVIAPMPPPGEMTAVSGSFSPACMVGMRMDLKNPFNFYFVMNKGEQFLEADIKKNEYNKLIKYFLASLTTPNNDMWVNLSPYESTRIIPDNFAGTEMGRDLLAQDYLLKQFASSLMYPEDETGKLFWERVYSRAQEEFGTTDIPVDTFNKVWIVPDRADIYQKDDTVFLVDSHLKVMMEQDFMAIEENKEMFGNVIEDQSGETDAARKIASDVVREVIIPIIEKEVNEGSNFAQVRQIYNSMILAAWFKKTLKESLLGQVYADKSKVAGVEVNDPQAREKIYQQYLEAYKIGVFNYIKEDMDPLTQEMLPRKYFSGGALPIDFDRTARAVGPQRAAPVLQAAAADSRLDAAQVTLATVAAGALALILSATSASPVVAATASALQDTDQRELVSNPQQVREALRSHLAGGGKYSQLSEPDQRLAEEMLVERVQQREARAGAGKTAPGGVLRTFDGNFSQAFAAARRAGVDTFLWQRNGKTYTTAIAASTKEVQGKAQAAVRASDRVRDTAASTIAGAATQSGDVSAGRLRDSARELEDRSADLEAVATDWQAKSSEWGASVSYAEQILGASTALERGDSSAGDQVKAVIQLARQNNDGLMAYALGALGGGFMGWGAAWVRRKARQLKSNKEANKLAAAQAAAQAADSEAKALSARAQDDKDLADSFSRIAEDQIVTPQELRDLLRGVRSAAGAARPAVAAPEAPETPVAPQAPQKPILQQTEFRLPEIARPVAVEVPRIDRMSESLGGQVRRVPEVLAAASAARNDLQAQVEAVNERIARIDAMENNLRILTDRDANITQAALEKAVGDESAVWNTREQAIRTQNSALEQRQRLVEQNMSSALAADPDADVEVLENQSAELKQQIADNLKQIQSLSAERVKALDVVTRQLDQFREAVAWGQEQTGEKLEVGALGQVFDAQRTQLKEVLSSVGQMRESLNKTRQLEGQRSSIEGLAARFEQMSAAGLGQAQGIVASRGVLEQALAGFQARYDAERTGLNRGKSLARIGRDMNRLNLSIGRLDKQLAEIQVAPNIVSNYMAQERLLQESENVMRAAQETAQAVRDRLSTRAQAGIRANADQDDVGGITMSDKYLKINIKVDGAGMPLPASMQDPAMVNIEGLSPIIREIGPVTPQNLPVLNDLMRMAVR